MEILELIPKDGIFNQYITMASQLTDAPDIYHIGSCLAMVSAAVSQYCQIAIPVKNPMNDKILESRSSCNLWILISGPSSDRKSSAMDIGVEIAQKVLGPNSSIAGSPEATFDQVAEDPSVFFYHREGAELFAQLQASYWLQGQGLLCSLYDGAEEYSRKLVGRRSEKKTRTKKRDTAEDTGSKISNFMVTIKNPRITMLIGIPPSKLNETKRSDWTGGLIGRMLVLHAERERYQPFLLKDDEGSDKIAKELSDIRAAVQAMGTLNLTMAPDCVAEYYRWARKIDIEMTSSPDKVRALYGRLANHIQRVAALYAISQYNDKITMTSLVPALRLGDEAKASIRRLGEILADDVIMRNGIKILDLLRKSEEKMLSIGIVSDNLSVSWSTLEPALRSLEAAGKVRVHMDQTNPKAKWLELVAK